MNYNFSAYFYSMATESNVVPLSAEQLAESLFELHDVDGNRIQPTDSLVRLVEGFGLALLNKLVKARMKYDYEGDEWMQPDWEEECRHNLLAHIDKGDPLDNAAFSAFQWFHKWRSTPTPTLRELFRNDSLAIERLDTIRAQATALTAAESEAATLRGQLAAAEAERNSFRAQVRSELYNLFGPLLYVSPGKDGVELSQQVRYELAGAAFRLGLEPMPAGHTYPAWLVKNYHAMYPGTPPLGKVEGTATEAPICPGDCTTCPSSPLGGEPAGRVDCPSCGDWLAWDESWAGTGSTCKMCGYGGAAPSRGEGDKKGGQADA